MTQKLFLEAHWEKQVSPQDRHLIEKVFSEVDFSDLTGLQATYLRHDKNYKGELLYIVLLHNCTEETITFNQHTVTIEDAEGNHISDQFDIPVELYAKTSMPWTFIFKEGFENIKISHSNIKL